MKKFLILLSIGVCGCTPLHYNLLNQNMSNVDSVSPYDEKKIYIAVKESKRVGYEEVEEIKNILEKLDEGPVDYFNFLELLREWENKTQLYPEITILDLFAPNYDKRSENVSVSYADDKPGVYVNETNFYQAIKNLKEGEESLFMEIQLQPLKSILKKLEGFDFSEENVTINVSYIPETILLKCKRIDQGNADCRLTDENNNEFEGFIEKWSVSYPKDLLKKIQRKTAKMKQEQRRLEEEERRWHKVQQEKCVPAIYVLHRANHQYVDPLLQKQATDTFVNYNCDDIAREIFEGR